MVLKSDHLQPVGEVHRALHDDAPDLHRVRNGLGGDPAALELGSCTRPVLVATADSRNKLQSISRSCAPGRGRFLPRVDSHLGRPAGQVEHAGRSGDPCPSGHPPELPRGRSGRAAGAASAMFFVPVGPPPTPTELSPTARGHTVRHLRCPTFVALCLFRRCSCGSISRSDGCGPGPGRVEPRTGISRSRNGSRSAAPC